MKDYLLSKTDLKLLGIHLQRNRMIVSRIFSPFLILNILVIIVVVINFPENDIALIWSVISLITVAVLLVITVKLVNRKIQRDKVDKLAKYITGKVTKKQDREHIKVVSRIVTKVPDRHEYVVEIDNGKVYEVENSIYEKLNVGDTALLKFAKNSNKYLSLMENQ